MPAQTIEGNVDALPKRGGALCLAGGGDSVEGGGEENGGDGVALGDGHGVLVGGGRCGGMWWT